MPITPSQLEKRRKATPFPFAGEDVGIEYYPAAINDESLTALRTLSAKIGEITDETPENEVDALYLVFGAWVARILASWDYYENPAADGTPGLMIPLTPERIAEELRRFGDFVGACVRAAITDYQGGKPTGDDSYVPSDAISSLTEASTSLTVKSSPKRSR